jgi:hypothetical protein
MSGPVESFWRIRLEDVKKSLEANNFEVFIAENAAAAKKVVLELNTIILLEEDRGLDKNGK